MMIPSTPPHLEPLEGRILMSGTVKAVLSRGALTITGDSQSNVVQLVRNGDTVSIIPDAATRINKCAAGEAVDLIGVTGAIKVVMGAGNDTLGISGQSVDGVAAQFAVAGGRGKLTIDLGAGNDDLVLAGVAAGDVSIVTGAGANRVVLTALDPDGTAGGPTDVRTVLLGGLTVTGAKGNESVELLGVSVSGSVNLKVSVGGNSATISPWAGSDADFDVSIGGSFTFDSSLAWLPNSVLFDDPDNAGNIRIGGSVSISLGLMSDTVMVTPAAGLSVGGSFFVSACLGDDVISVRGADIGGLLILYGSAGNNVITVENVDTGLGRWIDGNLTVSGFSLDMLKGLGLKLPSAVTKSISSCMKLFNFGSLSSSSLDGFKSIDLGGLKSILSLF